MKRIIAVGLLIFLLIPVFNVAVSAAPNSARDNINQAYTFLQKSDPKIFTENPVKTLSNEQSAELKSVADAQIKGASNNREKIYNLFCYVAKSIYYDYDFYYGKTSSVTADAYGVYKGKKTVCQGYAELYKTLCYLEKIPCRIVYGDNHAYNCAYDSGNKRWIVLDATWASANRYEDGKFSYKGTVNNYYFDMSVDALVSSAYHETYGFEFQNGNLIYRVNENYQLTVKKPLHKDISSADIPSAVGIFAVTGIDGYAFLNCKNLKSVCIPASIKYIGWAAFYRCEALEEINLPEILTRLESSVFYGCKSLKSIKIPESVKDIGSYAFAYCEQLSSVTVPNCVTNIDTYAFAFCGKLKTVTLPVSLKTVRGSAFYCCEKLKTVNYCGSKADRTAITFDSGNDRLTGAEWIIKNHDNNRHFYKTTLDYNSKYHFNKCSKCFDYINRERHTFNDISRKATLLKNGGTSTVCTVCGYEKVLTTVYKPTTFELSRKSYTYSGKARKPAVTVKDSKGNKISSKYYTVSYKDNKKIGKATVKVEMKGKYEGTKTLHFTIKPKPTSITKISPLKKAFKVTYKKQSVSGYQIKYSKYSGFSKYKTVKISGSKTVSKKISGLHTGRKYYVRVRTYKTVDKKVFYSSWSGTKTVKAK